MRKTSTLLSVLLMFFSFSLKSNYGNNHNRNCSSLDYIEKIIDREEKERKCLLDEREYKQNLDSLFKLKINVSLYFKTLGDLESSSDYSAVNRFGYLGKYQFSKRTLRDLQLGGYLKYNTGSVSYDLFLNDPLYQETAASALTLHNLKVLRRYLKFEGRIINGIRISREGMLSAAHLLGPYAVKHYLKTGGSMSSVKVGDIIVHKYDGNGTSIEDYLKKFQNV